LGWLAAAAALVLALAVAVLQHSRPVAVRAITAPTPAPPAMTEQADVPRAATAGAPAASRRRASRTPLPEVIVPAGEARRIEAYYAAVSRIEAAPALVAADELTIAPIEIEPLPDAGPGAGPAPGHGRGL
jgi:hypothetical protein